MAKPYSKLAREAYYYWMESNTWTDCFLHFFIRTSSRYIFPFFTIIIIMDVFASLLIILTHSFIRITSKLVGKAKSWPRFTYLIFWFLAFIRIVLSLFFFLPRQVSFENISIDWIWRNTLPNFLSLFLKLFSASNIQYIDLSEVPR
jgi:hypothetical protein